MKKIENLLSEKPKLTEEDIRYLLDALHAYKRSEIDYLLFIQDILTEEKYCEYRRKIEDRHQEVLEKLLSHAQGSILKF